MAEGKKSFLLYCDIIHTVEKLTDEQSGKLFKHILNYVNDKNPETDDFLISIAFEPIKQALKRDLVKYEKLCERNKINGLKGGRPSNPDEPKKPSGLSGNPDEPKKPDSDIDSDIDSGKEKEINISFDVFWKIYPVERHSKQKYCKEYWNEKLTDNQRSSIIEILPAYIKSVSELKYLKQTEFFFKNQKYTDESFLTLVKKTEKPIIDGRQYYKPGTDIEAVNRVVR